MERQPGSLSLAWSFPIVSVQMKWRPAETIPQHRFCADLRILNNKVLKDSCFIGSVPANLALPESHQFYRALDLFNAFESCAVAHDSRDFFSFSSPSCRQYGYKWLQQGFLNSPSIMSRMTSEILSGRPTSARAASQQKVDEAAEAAEG